MKNVPRTLEDLEAAAKDGFVFTSWWIHPELQPQAWWQEHPVRGHLYEESAEVIPFDFNESNIKKPAGWLATFRDLRPEHVPELELFRDGMYAFIEEVTGVQKQDLEVWTHTPGSLLLLLSTTYNKTVKLTLTLT